MIYGTYLSAAGMMANQYRQNVVANNLANIDTVGFKHDLALIQERPVETAEDPEVASFAHAMFDRMTGGLWALWEPSRLTDAVISGEGVNE